MIKRVRIENFQSLKNISLEFGKLTVIVGASDMGKSAFMRAVRALVENRRGDKFIHAGTDYAQVEIETDEHKIVWQKWGKLGGAYLLDDANADLGIALRTLKIAPVEIGHSIKIIPNFHRQLDKPFLLSESDATKSKVLGEITNANLILLSNSQFKRMANEAATYGSVARQNIGTFTVQLSHFAGVDERYAKAQNLKLISAQIQESIRMLEQMEESGQRLKQAMAAMHDADTKFQKLVSLTGFLSDTTLLKRIREQEDACSILEVGQERIKVEIKAAKHYQKLADILNVLPSVGSIEQKLKDVVSLEAYKIHVDKMGTEETVASKGEVSATAELEEATRANDAYLQEIKICPLCESVLCAC